MSKFINTDNKITKYCFGVITYSALFVMWLPLLFIWSSRDWKEIAGIILINIVTAILVSIYLYPFLRHGQNIEIGSDYIILNGEIKFMKNKIVAVRFTANFMFLEIEGYGKVVSSYSNKAKLSKKSIESLIDESARLNVRKI